MTAGCTAFLKQLCRRCLLLVLPSPRCVAAPLFARTKRRKFAGKKGQRLYQKAAIQKALAACFSLFAILFLFTRRARLSLKGKGNMTHVLRQRWAANDELNGGALGLFTFSASEIQLKDPASQFYEGTEFLWKLREANLSEPNLVSSRRYLFFFFF